MLRYYLGGTLLSRIATPFPTATFFINITGSFILGFFLTLATERINISPHLRLAIAVGFVGAYTTFSTFEYETARLMTERGFTLSMLYVVLSVAVGFAAVWSGIITARALAGAPLFESATYERFEQQANNSDPTQRLNAERDIRDSSIEM
jgi:CrcB protein